MHDVRLKQCVLMFFYLPHAAMQVSIFRTDQAFSFDDAIHQSKYYETYWREISKDAKILLMCSQEIDYTYKSAISQPPSKNTVYPLIRVTMVAQNNANLALCKSKIKLIIYTHHAPQGRNLEV